MPTYIDEEGLKDGELPMPPDPLLEKIKAYILSQYEPVQTVAEADVFMSTPEIFEAISVHYRNELLFDQSMLATWLHDNGFTFKEMGNMRFEWLLKRTTDTNA